MLVRVWRFEASWLNKEILIVNIFNEKIYKESRWEVVEVNHKNLITINTNAYIKFMIKTKYLIRIEDK